MIESFIEFFRSYINEVLVPNWNWFSKHKFGYFVAALIIGIAVMFFSYLTRDDNKKLKINNYDDEEES